MVESVAGGREGRDALNEFKNGSTRLQKCHSSNIDEGFDCVSFADGMICVEIKGEQQRLKIAMDNGDWVDTKTRSEWRSKWGVFGWANGRRHPMASEGVALSK